MESAVHASPDAEDATPGDAGESPDPKRDPSWWHRGHPVFIPLAGFFSGMLYMIVVPGTYAAIVSSLVDQARSEELFPFVLLTLVVPIGLLVPKHTRRFARYLVFGALATLVVVVGVAAITLWILYARDG